LIFPRGRRVPRHHRIQYGSGDKHSSKYQQQDAPSEDGVALCGDNRGDGKKEDRTPEIFAYGNQLLCSINLLSCCYGISTTFHEDKVFLAGFLSSAISSKLILYFHRLHEVMETVVKTNTPVFVHSHGNGSKTPDSAENPVMFAGFGSPLFAGMTPQWTFSHQSRCLRHKARRKRQEYWCSLYL